MVVVKRDIQNDRNSGKAMCCGSLCQEGKKKLQQKLQQTESNNEKSIFFACKNTQCYKKKLFQIKRKKAGEKRKQSEQKGTK